MVAIHISFGVVAIACGITGHYVGGDYKVYMPGVSFHVFETMSIFTIPITIMAFMTNITAIQRLNDARRALNLKDLENSKVLKGAKVLVIAGFILVANLGFGQISNAIAQNSDDPSPIKFPTPKGIKNQLFYLQRDPNTNTIICELNVDSKGKLNDDEPIKVYWIRYQDENEVKALNYVQRKFAYGVESKAIGNNEYKLNFVSYKKFPMYLMKSKGDNKYHVYVTANNKRIQLERIFLRIEGGTFWVPNVKYVELKGTNPTTGAAITERIKV